MAAVYTRVLRGYATQLNLQLNRFNEEALSTKQLLIQSYRLRQLEKQSDVTRMLMSLSAVYLLMLVAGNSLEMTSDLVPMTSSARRLISLIGHWLDFAGTAVNPLLYTGLSQQIRSEIVRTFFCWTGSGSFPLSLEMRSSFSTERSFSLTPSVDATNSFCQEEEEREDDLEEEEKECDKN